MLRLPELVELLGVEQLDLGGLIFGGQGPGVALKGKLFECLAHL